MSGIAGFTYFTQSIPDASEHLLAMMSAIQHRGPYGSGMYLDNYVALGHNRLSTIDTQTGNQPIYNEEQTLWLVCAGAIFNYQELRNELEGSGHKFYTLYDTEVIVHLYEQLGMELLLRLNGQFAFALWDTKKKILILARDRFGVQPLHYTFYEKNFYFGSEIKSIFATGEIPRALDPLALEQIFTIWAPLPGSTAFQNVSELRPGHFAIVSADSFAEKKYWDIPYCPHEDHLKEDPRELAAQAGELLKDAIRLRLRSDVQVGAYLSGGLDSSGICALVAQHFNSDLHTFGVRFEEQDFDEGVYQNQMSSFLNVKHAELNASNDDIARAFAQQILYAEKPLLRTAAAPLFLLSDFTRKKGIKSVLTGEGSDEVFGGYDIFKEALLRRFLARQPQSSCRRLPFEHLYPDIFKNERAKKSLALFFGATPDDGQDQFYSHSIRWGNTSRSKIFFSDKLRASIGEYNVYEDLASFLPDGFSKRDCLAKAQYLEMIIFMTNYLLSSQGDRSAMPHGLEMRLPFLDHRLAEFMAKVPPAWKILGIKEKYLLKKYFKGILPDTIVDRTKHPYRAPVHQSLCSSFARDDIHFHLSVESLEQSGFFNPVKVQHLFKKITSNKNVSEVDAMALAGIYSSQLLDYHFVQNRPATINKTIHPATIIDKRNI